MQPVAAAEHRSTREQVRREFARGSILFGRRVGVRRGRFIVSGDRWLPRIRLLLGDVDAHPGDLLDSIQGTSPFNDPNGIVARME